MSRANIYYCWISYPSEERGYHRVKYEGEPVDDLPMAKIAAQNMRAEKLLIRRPNGDAEIIYHRSSYLNTDGRWKDYNQTDKIIPKADLKMRMNSKLKNQVGSNLGR